MRTFRIRSVFEIASSKSIEREKRQNKSSKELFLTIKTKDSKNEKCRNTKSQKEFIAGFRSKARSLMKALEDQANIEREIKHQQEVQKKIVRIKSCNELRSLQQYFKHARSKITKSHRKYPSILLENPKHNKKKIKPNKAMR